MKHSTRGTQREIAEKANVSQALVSRVLSGSSIDVGEETRLRILRVAQKLGYTPRAKRVAPAKRGKLLAYIQPLVARGAHQEDWIYQTYEEFYQTIHAEMLTVAHASGYALMAQPYTDAASLMQWLTEWNVDGVFWHARDEVLLQWIADRFPTVQINRHDAINADAVSSNQEELILLALDHLRAQGHQRIAFMPQSPVKDRLWMMRTRAYEDYCERHRLPMFTEEMARLSGFPPEEAARFLEWVAAGGEAPTALVLTDHNALRLLKIASERGVEIPRQLSLVGIDNVSASPHTSPPLTSVDPCMSEIARVAVGTLLERLEHPGANPRKVLVSPRLVCRSSVADLRLHSLTPAPSSLP